MSEEKKNPPRAQIFRYFRIESRNNRMSTAEIDKAIQQSFYGGAIITSRPPKTENADHTIPYIKCIENACHTVFIQFQKLVVKNIS